MLLKEIEHARSYASIQHARFSDRIRMEFDQLPKLFEHFYVPRLILQPIIENAFEHGLENKESDGLLRITFVEAHPFLEIHVEDNGDQADSNTLERITASIRNRDSNETTALINIHRRLQIFFGKNSGLEIRRSRLGGLEVIIKLFTGTEKES